MIHCVIHLEYTYQLVKERNNIKLPIFPVFTKIIFSKEHFRHPILYFSDPQRYCFVIIWTEEMQTIHKNKHYKIIYYEQKKYIQFLQHTNLSTVKGASAVVMFMVVYEKTFVMDGEALLNTIFWCFVFSSQIVFLGPHNLNPQTEKKYYHCCCL